MEFVFDRGSRGSGAAFAPQEDFNVNSPIRRVRKPVAAVDEIEIQAPPRRRRKATPKTVVKYSRKSKRSVSSNYLSKMSWFKLGWAVCACLLVRLVFMENGVLDYISMDKEMKSKTLDTISLREDNKTLIEKIHLIKTSPRYQKKMAREHLGVISASEYLVLFAGD